MPDMEVMRALGRIEGKLEGVLAEQKRVADYAVITSQRVAKLELSGERAHGWAAGAGAVAAVIMTLVIAATKWLLTKAGMAV